MPDAKPTAPSQPSPPHAPQESSGAPVAVDLQAEIQKALEAERERWRQQLKETLGVDSLEAWKEQRLKEEGKLQELLQQKEQEATHYRQQFERLAIQNALLTAARNAVDPEVVLAILAPKAKVGEDGAVTVDGKPVEKAVEELLKAKPYLARPTGNQGSGAPLQAGRPQMTRAQFEVLSPEDRMKFIRSGGQVVD